MAAPRSTAGYRIRTAARLTGLTPEVLRAWERRYGLTRPARSAGRFRLYSDNDLEILRGAKALVDAGQAIGEVARLPHRRLREAAPQGLLEPRSPALPTRDSDRDRSGGRDGGGERGRDAVAIAVAVATGEASATALGQTRAEMLAAAAVFDRVRIDRLLDGAASTMAPLDLCKRLLVPLLRDLGEAWHRDEIPVAVEHFASALVRARLVRVLEQMPHGPGRPRIVCACPAGEQHEGALLAFAVHAAAAGWEVIYLGADVPDAEILDAAERTTARAVALSLTVTDSEARLRRLLSLIEGRRARGVAPRIIAGGRAATAHRALLAAHAIEIADDVAAALTL